MQSITNYIPQPNSHQGAYGRGGGRASSPAYRESLSLSEGFAGLESSTNRYDLLLLVKRTGKAAGFSPRMVQLLDYYMAFTTELDWEEGSRPIVFQSLSRTAFDLGVSERQVQKLEKQLFDAGAITHHDSGNHKRYGRRDPVSGRLLFAFGVDLTPLAYLREELEQKLHDKRLYEEAWLETKRQISWLRRQVRALLLELREEGADVDGLAVLEADYESIAIQLRTHIDLPAMRALLEQHQRLHERCLEAVNATCSSQEEPVKETDNGSCTSEPAFAHYKYTTPSTNICSPEDPCFQKSVAGPSEPIEPATAHGAEHVSLRQVLQAASERFRSHLPLEPRPMNWNEAIEAAYRLRTRLGISQQSWSEACGVLGRAGATLCVLLTDRAIDRPDNPVREPAAYFRGMVNRARAGELRLHNSVFGLLD